MPLKIFFRKDKIRLDSSTENRLVLGETPFHIRDEFRRTFKSILVNRAFKFGLVDTLSGRGGCQYFHGFAINRFNTRARGWTTGHFISSVYSGPSDTSASGFVWPSPNICLGNDGGKRGQNDKIVVVDSSDCCARQSSAVTITWITRTSYNDNVEFPVPRKSNIRPSLFVRNDVPQS